MPKYLDIKETLKDSIDLVIVGPIKDTIEHLQEIIADHPAHRDIRIVKGIFEPSYFEVVGTRQETDAERNKRLQSIKRSKAKQAEWATKRKAALIKEAQKLGLVVSEK